LVSAIFLTQYLFCSPTFFAVAQQLKLRDIFDVIQLREQVKLRCLTVKALRGEYRV